MPAYNEEATVLSVLERLEPLVDEIIVVDDGSTDRTREVVFTWAESRPNIQLIFFDQNRGMSAAYYEAFRRVGQRVAQGELSPDDIIFTVDADGQHEPRDLDALMAQLVDAGYDAVIARRDLSTYTAFKRFGNWLLSLWASLWAGHRLYDVESGFRAFRVGPLLDALRYYRGYKYSETVEVAVVLLRLGYRVCNDVPVPVPRFRSRTRVKDGLIDFAAIPAAWWRVVAGRNRPHDMPAWSLYVLPTLGVLGLLFIVVDLLINPLFLASDSMISYAHVWYLSNQMFQHATVPLRIALLDSGRAVAFPYAIVPYLVGAVLFPLLRDWGVTLLMAVAVVGTVWTAGMARPVMRDPWFVLLFIVNPFFIDAVYAFQFATLWSILFFFLFVWAFERRRYLLAAALLWLTVSSHPVIGTEAAGVYGLCLLIFDRKRVPSLLLLSIPVAVALTPIYWMTALAAGDRETSLGSIAISTADSLLRRGTILAAPFLLTLLAPYVRRFYRPSLAALALVAVLALAWSSGIVQYPGSPGGYYGAIHRSSDVYAAFFRSPGFEPGATYRVLEPTQREDGMYRFMQHGAVISNEFFNEAFPRRSWTEAQYGCYGAFKGIDFVVVEKAYLKRYRVNERDLLDSLVRTGRADITYADPHGRFTVYNIRKFVAEQPKPASLKDCGVY